MDFARTARGGPNMTGFILRAAIAALGLWLATEWLDGLSIDSPMNLLLAGVLLGIVNAVVKPIVILLVINAAMLGLVAALLPGMQIMSFWAAMLGALIVSAVSWVGWAVVGARH